MQPERKARQFDVKTTQDCELSSEKILVTKSFGRRLNTQKPLWTQMEDLTISTFVDNNTFAAGIIFDNKIFDFLLFSSLRKEKLERIVNGFPFPIIL